MAFFDLRNARRNAGRDFEAGDESRERLIDAMWDWSCIASAFVTMGATAWLVVAIWRAA